MFIHNFGVNDRFFIFLGLIMIVLRFRRPSRLVTAGTFARTVFFCRLVKFCRNCLPGFVEFFTG